MLKKTALLLGLSTVIFSTAFADSVCPTAAEIHTAQYQTTFGPAFFIYTLPNSMVIVSIPPTDANPHPTQKDAQKLLNATTRPYPNNLSEPCFYAPGANEKTDAAPFVMWSDQKPPL